LQWNGIAANAGVGPLGRNAGEVIGVFATLNWHVKTGFSLSSIISGQSIGRTHISYETSIKMQNLRLIELQLANLQSPSWNDSQLKPILGSIELDTPKVRRGEQIFEQKCASCHARIQRDDPNRRIVASMTDIGEAKTDDTMATKSVKDKGLSGYLRNEYVDAGPGNVLIDETAPAAALLTKATISVVATPENKFFLIRGYDWAYNLIFDYIDNKIKPSLKHGDYTPDTTAKPYASLNAYKGRSLNGIWATAPYLHNGSVPTLYDLLLPPEQRPTTFMVGSREFDPVKVGFRTDGYVGFVFDTKKPGNSNSGHVYGTELAESDRKALVEYLKTL
jgi:mono/diheme cytochrome c family protein